MQAPAFLDEIQYWISIWVFIISKEWQLSENPEWYYDDFKNFSWKYKEYLKEYKKALKDFEKSELKKKFDTLTDA